MLGPAAVWTKTPGSTSKATTVPGLGASRPRPAGGTTIVSLPTGEQEAAIAMGSVTNPSQRSSVMPKPCDVAMTWPSVPMIGETPAFPLLE